ncbi:Calmodulin [Lamellibrachia satsuma]|nr:Calmodulin [Lamellibrachia satsuma]
MEPEENDEKDKEWMAAYNLTENQVQEMKETFAMFEVDGAITTHQLGLALRAMGQNPSEGEIQTLASSAELSENGTINLEEYMRVLGSRGLKSESEMEEELEEALKVFDKEGDGYILASEFKEALQTLGEPVDKEDLAELLKTAEVDHEGKIFYYDFIRKMINT